MSSLAEPLAVRPLRAGMTGTWRLLRLAARRDRVLLPVWLLVIAGLVAGATSAMAGLYPTAADRLAYAAVSANTIIARAFDGPIMGTSLGAVFMVETWAVVAVLVAIMSVQAVVRHTRADEEMGRAELVGSAAVGRQAPLTAALGIAIGANGVLLVAVTASLVANGLPLAGSIAAAGATVGVGITFAGVAAVTAQISSSRRGANGLAIGVLGAAFLLRAVGDAFGSVRDSGLAVVSAWPSWASPIGWGHQVRPFAGERWGLLLVFPVVAAVLVAVAFWLRSQRDVGAGLLAVPPGPATASTRLCTPWGLAWRLQRWTVLAWLLGLVILSAAFGSIAERAEELLATSDEFAALVTGMGEGAVTDLFFAFFVGLLAVTVSGLTVQSMLRARHEESNGGAEPVLATGVSRTRWLASHMAVSAGGSATALLVAGLAGGLTHAAVSGDIAAIPELLEAVLAALPAVLCLGGLVVAAIGLVPRWAAPVGWSGLVAALVVGQFGALFELPQAVLNISPFTHVPAVPAQPWAWTPVIALLGVACGLAILGMAAFRRRDLRN